MRHLMQEQFLESGVRVAEVVGVSGRAMDTDIIPQGGHIREMAEDAAGTMEDADGGVVDPVAEDGSGQSDFAGCQEAAGKIAIAGDRGLIR